MRKVMSLFLVLSFALAPLSGCASQYGSPQTEVNYYPRCYQPIQDLRSREHQVGKSTATGAIIGALGGALLGLLASDGRWQGAMMGAAVGGVGGSMAGHAYGSRQKELDDNRRLASYLQDMDGDIYDMDISTAAARSSLECYDAQFNRLLAAIREKKISRQAAAARFAEISSGREEAINILGNVARAGENLDQRYEEAFMAEERDLELRGAHPDSKKQQRALNTARQKKKAISQKSAKAQEEKAAAQTATASQTQSINQAMAGLEELRI